MSPCSSSCACGMISLSTKLLTVDRISRWMSVRSAVCAKRVTGALLRDSGVRVTGEYGPRPAPLRRVPGHLWPVGVVEYPDRDGPPGGRMSTDDENLYRGDPPPPAGPPPGYPPPGYGPPGYPPVYVRPTNTMAILALVMAFVFAPAGLILGIVARKQIRETGEDGDGLALAGIIVGGIVTAIFVFFIVLWIIAFAAFADSGFGP